jgi:ubiquinone/menaquinone biosynthesis C-methylase UbiE
MSFDRVADVYWLLEKLTFRNVLQRARTFGIDQISDPKRALVAGDGDGRFLETLMRVHRNLQVDSIDSSERMLELARLRLQRSLPQALERVRFHRWDIGDAVLSNGYDLIVTHFFLDCFEGDELKKIVRKISGVALPDCVWLLADFAIPDGGWREQYAKAWIAMMYRFFRLTTDISATWLSDPTCLLQQLGFELWRQKRWHAGMVKSEIWKRPGG